MIYAQLEGEQIVAIRAGDPARTGAKQWVELPQQHQVRVGTTVAWYDDSWQQRAVSELVADRLIEPPQGMVWDERAADWRRASDAELVADGRRTLGERELLDGDTIRPMTEPELYEAGLLTPQERREYERQETLRQLENLDAAALRPLRAILAGKQTDRDVARLAEIETEAEQLRERLRNAGTGAGTSA